MRVLLCLLPLLFIGASKAAVINFESGSINQDNFEISSISGTLRIFNNEFVPDSGSNALLVNGGSPASFELSHANNNLFDLFSFSASEGRNIDTEFFPRFWLHRHNGRRFFFKVAAVFQAPLALTRLQKRIRC